MGETGDIGEVGDQGSAVSPQPVLLIDIILSHPLHHTYIQGDMGMQGPKGDKGEEGSGGDVGMTVCDKRDRNGLHIQTLTVIKQFRRKH